MAACPAPQASGNGKKLRKQPKARPALPQTLYVESEWLYSNKPANVFSLCKALILTILGFQRKILLLLLETNIFV